MAINVTAAGESDAQELAGVAAATFPLACPASADPADIAEFVATNLSAQRFTQYLTDPGRLVLAATDGRHIVGYSMLIDGVGDDPAIAASVSARPAVELSKMYVLAAHHRTGAAAALMAAGISWATRCGAAVMWLGVNQNNERAQRFYRKHGFEVAGIRTFWLGPTAEADFVMQRPIGPPD